MRKYLFLLGMMLLTCTSMTAQSSMTDNQIMDYVIEQNAKGVSRQQIVTQLMQRGVTIDQLRRIQKKYQKQIKNGALGAEDITAGSKAVKNRMREANGEKREEQVKKDKQNASQFRVKDGKKSNQIQRHTYDDDDKDFVEMDEAIDFMMPDSLKYKLDEQKPEKRKIFGHDVFNNKNLTFESSMNLATPQNYVLGPGDEVNVDIWGASQESITESVSPDGTITIEGIGVIKLGGLSVSQAKAKLKQVIGPRYQGSQIDLTLGQTRTITISVMGEVKVPGTYTMSAFATVYNALYMAGGPNEIGTLRNVKVYRKGKLLSNVDVYDFLLNGKLSGDVRLQDNDVITVSPYETLVNITGKVKRPMFYEMKENESAATLLRYAGGFTGDAYTKAIRVNRKAGAGYSVFNIGEFDMNSFKLMDEDSVSIDSTLNRYQNMVEIRGAVFRPGMYQVGGEINTVKALIEAAAGVTEEAISQHAVMHRIKADRSLEMISLDLRAIMEGTAPDIALKNEDVIYIASRQERNEKKTVTINGEVAYPGVYRYAENETLEDLIIQAGGPTEAASLAKVDVARRITNPNSTEAGDQIAQNFSFKLNPDFTISEQPDFTLQPFDEVYVRRSPDYNEQQNVTIEGEVQFSGNYALSSKGQRLSEVIKMAGGLTNQAYAEGTKLLRQMTSEERDMMETMLRTAQRNSGNDSIDVKKLMTNTTYPVGIELDKALKNPGTDDDPILREGDRIVVPRYDGTVKINGEVLFPNTVYFKEGKSTDYYINLAGGTTSTAKKSMTVIIYMNGMVARADRKHKPRPGCQIVVPTKSRRKGMSLPEILSIGSSTASIATMIATIANLTK
ncbi:SLBB domain-containing protein [Prevotella communis]|uniref:SLBB domain-containing protein n=1 Tax=Prevotella communis TaxID=2913614 RepID=UPI001EDB877A|nr:SLBB domain-containing protein [Prevotella communis]UKK60219.1 SLBB domain-containing protein [Prevotella communis]UKK62953.1 SLBB domain-containing protein [Prevotella communis]UKK65778.1 SLBB domain-containing protein [Prevotella communis]UKK68198.1 SLBB domain-containing protein [Prevotella communis]UKK69667.1 SLBB domain-containing protein [Prevotella communis]